jgi:hypothetical protein
VPAQVSACRQFWTYGPAGQSLVGLHNILVLPGSHVPFPSSPHGDVAWSRMSERWCARVPEIGGPRLSGRYGLPTELGGPPVLTASQPAKWTRPVSGTNQGSTCQFYCHFFCARAITSLLRIQVSLGQIG